MIQSISLGPVAPTKLIETKPIEQSTPAELTQNFSQFLQTAIDNVSAQEKMYIR